MKKNLIFLVVFLILLKLGISFFIQVPLGFADSFYYFEEAKSFFDNPSLASIATSGTYPPFYPMLISPAFIFSDMNLVFFFIKLIGIILSSLVIIPAYLISKEFFNEKKSIMISLIISIIPDAFIFSFYAFSENIIFTLFLFTVYFLLKSFTEKKIKWEILSGIFIGLCILTRIISIFLLPVIFFLILIYLFRENKKMLFLRNKLLLLLALLATLLPWIITKIILNGFSLIGIFGYTNSINKIIWTFFYIDYLIISLGIIFFILSVYLLFKYKYLNQKERLFLDLTFLSTIFVILIAANHSGAFEHYNDYRILGRYISVLFPLFIILGFIALEKYQSFPKKLVLAVSSFLAITTPFIIYNLFFPANNSSWISIGILKYILEIFTVHSTIIITLVIIILSLSLILIKKLNFKYLTSFFLIYFFSLSLLSSAVIVYDSQYRWLNLEQVQLGFWINENLKKDANYLIDIDDKKNYTATISEDPSKPKDRPITIIAYWIRGSVKEDNISNYQNYDYVISTKNLNLSKIKEGDSIKIYKTK